MRFINSELYKWIILMYEWDSNLIIGERKYTLSTMGYKNNLWELWSYEWSNECINHGICHEIIKS